MSFQDLIQSYKDIDEDDDYESLVKAKNFLEEGNTQKALELLQIVQNDMEKQQKRTVRTSLRELMEHVFLCIDFPEKMRENDALWLKKIWECRENIAYIMAIQPKIDQNYLESIWEEEQQAGLDFARIYEKVTTEKLTWEQVFEIEHGALKTQNHG